MVSSHLRDNFSEDDDHGLQRKKSPSAPQPSERMLKRELLQLTVETRTAAIPPPRTLSRKIGSDSLTICISSHRTFAPTSQIIILPSIAKSRKSSDEHAKQTIEKPASTCTYDVTQQQDDQDPMSPTLEQLEDFRGVLLFGRVRG